MGRFEILCVTMNQTDFSKIQEMNIHSDVVFANQADRTGFDVTQGNGFCAKMITTETRGVGINRNIALLHASGEICLMADDDVVYIDGMEQRVLAEFDAHPDADIMIFHFDTDSEDREQISYSKTRACGRLERMPWAGFRIAFRLGSVRKANLMFHTLFGGGCVFPSGEDSIWLIDAKKAGLTIYVSKETIGTVSFQTSTWFTGRDARFFFGKGAFYAAVYPKTFWIWACYFVLRTGKYMELSPLEKLKWINHGREGYRKLLSYEQYVSSIVAKRKEK